MAKLMSFSDPNTGASFTDLHWDIVDAHISFLASAATFEVHGWVSADAKASGKQPVAVKVFTISASELADVLAAALPTGPTAVGAMQTACYWQALNTAADPKAFFASATEAS